MRGGSLAVSSIFLLNPPNSGSTAMAILLLTAPRAWSATPNAEGQFVPDVKEEMRHRPWDPAIDFDWKRIKQCWLNLQPPHKTLMIEKSPPNLLRVRSIMRVFENSVFVISNRDPYASISSIVHRYFHSDLEEDRRNLMRQQANMWLFRSERQIDNITLLRGRSVITTYETFCQFPNGLLNNLYSLCGDLEIDISKKLGVKEYPPQRVMNMNDRQISWLTEEDIAVISEALSQNKQVVDFFGYRIIGATPAV